ncbi:hypothetical protein PCANC_12938 [Puccinia coronata f. sp. avenae]|uniref:Uncharacterized protein n=1 Tax=Puccinia coronata f. sp. avenae TaxID=200324 RepID=A0A2N5UN92_9BASI|nr:hypothetical protein PCASD_25282 [Puccinia coronata f. sp. avenae]PLW06489.1 hypothetical protein PCASD_26479 [Puccinia coronata f. sp. avenae]PLW10907.1 hypothetical protein PCANC_19130 [Puccinia coronata f. sp. avenae]PLW35786.1 hypothetical protein PCASD_15708 [Puccinia coronata f. sp. avenae]PLW35805.1 hypothetical protein PCASD_15702 [Puccinia coronata f. sp. avenae]
MTGHRGVLYTSMTVHGGAKTSVAGHQGPAIELWSSMAAPGHCVMELNGRARPLRYGA